MDRQIWMWLFIRLRDSFYKRTKRHKPLHKMRNYCCSLIEYYQISKNIPTEVGTSRISQRGWRFRTRISGDFLNSMLVYHPAALFKQIDSKEQLTFLSIQICRLGILQSKWGFMMYTISQNYSKNNSVLLRGSTERISFRPILSLPVPNGFQTRSLF